jgi:hypothetical protein
MFATPAQRSGCNSGCLHRWSVFQPGHHGPKNTLSHGSPGMLKIGVSPEPGRLHPVGAHGEQVERLASPHTAPSFPNLAMDRVGTHPALPWPSSTTPPPSARPRRTRQGAGGRDRRRHVVVRRAAFAEVQEAATTVAAASEAAPPPSRRGAGGLSYDRSSALVGGPSSPCLNMVRGPSLPVSLWPDG